MAEIKAQEGPQTQFLSTKADIAIYGGAAGGGKSFALLLEGLRHINNPKFNFNCFRRTTTQIRNNGGLWDESMALYNHFGSPIESSLMWKFNSGAKGKFSHLEYEKDVYNYQGSQIPLIMWDELTHFTEKMFFYMMSRNRTTCGVKPYMRGTCNPDPDSFVLPLIEWYLDGMGYADKSKGGIVRYLYPIDGEFVFGDNPEELQKKYKQPHPPLSFTFIPSNVEDNKILLESDPSYMTYLNSLPSIERAQLKDGNWYASDPTNRRYYAFNEHKHVAEFEQKGYPVYIGQDFNVDRMGGVLCEIYDDTIYIFDEIYLTHKDANTYSLRDHVSEKFGHLNLAFVPDSTGANRKTSAPKTDHQILRDAGFKVESSTNPAREDRFNCTNGLLEQNRIIVHPRCKHTIADLKNTKKIDSQNKKNGVEIRGHITDGLGYVAWKFFPLQNKRKSRMIQL